MIILKRVAGLLYGLNRSTVCTVQLHYRLHVRRLPTMSGISLLPQIVLAKDVKDDLFDGVVVVTDSDEHLPTVLKSSLCTITEYLKHDAAAKSSESAVILCPEIPSRRLIYTPTGPVTRDYDDVRRFQEAAEKGIKRALSAGCKSPLLVCPTHDRYSLAARVTALGALHAVYVPLEVREAKPDKARKVAKLGLLLPASAETELATLVALETGRTVYRDIGGSDPERMAAPKVAEYVENLFRNTCIKVNVISDLAVLEKEYPLLVAVNRAARNVTRHAPRVIQLEYVGEGTIDTTLMLVGKGITYDTGGADVKHGGAMAGMHRDKCGAAFVAGFFQMLSVYRPKGLKVVGAMAMVRNSIGSESYVSDELLTSRAGVRVRIGNTDAEGRMVMCDVLCQMKEKAVHEVNPKLFTIATLTGHVIRAFGDCYTGIIDNGPAKKAGVSQSLQDAGDLSGDMFEISTLRREDFNFHRGKSEYEDVLQSGGKPSTLTDRGHQSPAAFLILGSGLDKHGNDSAQPLQFSHVDIAGSSGPYPGIPTGAPIVAMAHAFVLSRESAAK
jgi:leucyl aminopeptidase